ncbi:MAG: PAS domain-containing protein [Rhodospirillaceae bacterium]|nr:PAS domain-containing protein [Rhodospirillaceae bacterium]
MSDSSDGTEQAIRRRALGWMIATGAGLAVAALVGVVLVMQFIAAERARELSEWQTRLNIVADSRAADVERWVDRQYGVLRELAQNASLQLYMTVSTDAGTPNQPGQPNPDDQAEIVFLRSLLTVTADQTGFRPRIERATVRANVERTGIAGIALLDGAGAIVAASPGMPPIEGQLLKFVLGAEKGERALSAMYEGPDGAATMAFLAPVFGVQDDQSAAAQIGVVIGVKPVAAELFPRLRQPGASWATAEALLVRQTGNSVRYLSPLTSVDGAPASTRTRALDTPDLAATFALRTPGGFAARTDYRGDAVLVTARALSNSPWTLLYKIDSAEALAASEARLTQMVVAFGLIIGLVLIAMAALWHHGASRRASQSAARFESLASRFQHQRDFMHLVTDNQPNRIIIFDEKGHYRWFNAVAVAMSGLDRKDLFDKAASAVWGPVEGKKIVDWIKACLDAGEPMSVTHTMLIEDRGGIEGQVEIVFKSDFIPLPARDDVDAGVLMVSQDISESVRERTRRERILRQLVNALVSVVDSRDPYSAHHSIRVGQVARAIATEMGLESELQDSVEIAGNLMNLGKIAIPESVLTKTGGLTDEEIETIRQSTLHSADMIAEIEFDGPVAETLRQLQEHFDGSGGPRGLSGDDILATARVVAVANTFVGMVSARAYRPGMDFDKAIQILFNEAGAAYDRRAVSALTNYVDNRGGLAEWRSFSEPPDETEG